MFRHRGQVDDAGHRHLVRQLDDCLLLPGSLGMFDSNSYRCLFTVSLIFSSLRSLRSRSLLSCL